MRGQSSESFVCFLTEVDLNSMCNNKIKSMNMLLMCASSYRCISFGSRLTITRLTDYYTITLILKGEIS